MPINNQQKQFSEMIQANERLVYKVCSLYAVDAEDTKDLFQEIILQAWSAYHRFRNESSISTWLYRVALNTAIVHKRKRDKHSPVSAIDFSGFEVEDKIQNQYTEEYRILYKLIATLPALDKALVLLYMEDRPHQEIADILGISLSNVGTKLGRIKDKLKKQAQPFVD